MKKQMKLAAILLAAVGLMVLENKAQAQNVDVRFSFGARPHYGAYYGGGYYQPPVVCQPPVVYNRGYYDDCRRPIYRREYRDDRWYGHDNGRRYGQYKRFDNNGYEHRRW